MRREDLVDLIGRIPEADHAKLQLVLRNGMTISTDAILRFEDYYVVVRGREAGQTEENRAFFIPFDEVLCLKIERIVQLAELAAMYGMELPNNAKPQSASPTDEKAPAAETAPPPPSAPVDPAEIAKQNLLARLRAARTAATAARSFHNK
jgi:hypothetical protein